ncbi:condensation domain-containing protein [Coxiella burnetii]|uniref:condensation domain-containing protein n=1 Tax=Coxiella burnetii TaxID=777 RepID=UPI000594A62F|nr:condensation domain-containing protein [Coxiella burnetii]ATN74791.1 peptide synthetase [Coxiella burnetii]ATN76695.1 peptide synthetase [Coxiella burnetii]ATN78613.1 peptide synthetase [Coxiella burnetii]ATN80522.1 peptide synthetase [Coxiella burnetii]OYK90410.1 peptide synthetase [Coxiella burnetii]
MKRIVASPYVQAFWIEYQRNPLRYDYNMVADQTVIGDLDIEQLRQAGIRCVKEHVLLNSHLVEQNGQLYWEENTEIYPLEIYDGDEKELEFVLRPFDLEKGPLYRFGIFKRGLKTFDWIGIFHHALIDGRDYPDFVKLFSTYFNDPSFSIDESIEEQRNAIQQLNKTLHKKVAYIREHHAREFWKKNLTNLPSKNELPRLPCLGSEKKNVCEVHVKEIRFKLDTSV